VLTLKAAGLVDIDAGSIVRPGILRIDGDRIAAVGGPVSPDDEVIDLGSLILPPGLMDMEVNLLMGGRGEPVHLSPGRTTRRCGCRACYRSRSRRGSRTVSPRFGARSSSTACSAAPGNSPARPELAWWRSGPRPGWWTYEA
jgi:hypothetical protein